MSKITFSTLVVDALAEEIVVDVFSSTTSTFDKVEEPAFEISKTTSLFVIAIGYKLYSKDKIPFIKKGKIPYISKK